MTQTPLIQNAEYVCLPLNKKIKIRFLKFLGRSLKSGNELTEKKKTPYKGWLNVYKCALLSDLS